MLRVVIAEDEALIREGLKREIPWASLGMEVFGLAVNGLEAVELCRDCRADILLTDIRMPLLDGLTLIERVKELPGGVVCLIISGYGDFQYAQKAISLGVSHYFLKPLELDQIEAKLREIGARILLERRRSAEQQLMGQFVSKVLPFVRRQYFLELIYGPYENREVARRLSALGALHDGSYCAAALVQVAFDGAGQRNRIIEQRQRRLLHNRHYRGEDIYLLKRTDTEALLVVVFVGDDPEELGASLSRYLREVRLLGSVRAAAGGSVHQSVGRLHESFVEARKELLLQNLLRRSGLASPPESGEPRAGFDFRGVEEALSSGNTSRLEELLDDLEATLIESPGSERDRTAVLIELFRTLSRPAEDSGINLETAFRRSEEGAVYDRSDGASGEIFSSLKKIALETAARHSTRREKPARYLIDKARQYIEQCYSAWDLSLEDVADHVELNPSYLSAVFKSVVGVNYIDYLTALRMEKAKQLLKDTRLKIGAVARMVGFQAPGYFGYLFKKHFGLPPSEYKACLES